VTFDLDPEKALWVPGRRRFLFLSGLTLAGTVLGVKAPHAELRFHPLAFSMTYPLPAHVLEHGIANGSLLWVMPGDRVEMAGGGLTLVPRG
jgi:hypothetical protein